MAERKRLYGRQTYLKVIFSLTVVACIACAIVTIAAFVLYVRARLADRSESSSSDAAELANHARRMADLDRREQFYQSLHFITLALFVLFGVLILVQLSIRLNRPHLLNISSVLISG
ncbi:MAG TPA: hypothetical protein VNU70_03690 [Puia sp.]|jgi:hypothetical protein|nr:hypothetical protein [Puia sp.]